MHETYTQNLKVIIIDNLNGTTTTQIKLIES